MVIDFFRWVISWFWGVVRLMLLVMVVRVSCFLLVNDMKVFSLMGW